MLRTVHVYPGRLSGCLGRCLLNQRGAVIYFLDNLYAEFIAIEIYATFHHLLRKCCKAWGSWVRFFPLSKKRYTSGGTTVYLFRVNVSRDGIVYPISPHVIESEPVVHSSLTLLVSVFRENFVQSYIYILPLYWLPDKKDRGYILFIPVRVVPIAVIVLSPAVSIPHFVSAEEYGESFPC